MKRSLLFLLVFLPLLTTAQVRLPRIFGDHMVLQRGKPINVWGWAKPKEQVVVKVNKQSVKTTADKEGKWKAVLAPEQAGGPYEISVVAKSSSVIFKDVLVGEVWICSGQSNMEWPLRLTDNSKTAISSANFPTIRHIKIPNRVASQPKEDFESGDWQVCSPTTAADFTAVGFYFAQKIQGDLNVPVGLINTSWGGTHSETWTSRGAFEQSAEFKEMIAGMPQLDLDKIRREKTEQITAKIAKQQGSFPPSKEEVATWSLASLDDSAWPVMKAPGLWESQSLPDLDGTVWFRKAFDLPAADASKAATLWVGMIDDSDETFVNGVQVGSMNQWNKLREYSLAPGVLKPGRNVIAIRCIDTGGGGGIHGDQAMLHVVAGGSDVSLAGDWRYKIESAGAAGSVGPNDYPTLLYNAMLKPLIPYTIAGALWYQGESNAGRAFQYRTAFPLMINDWRTSWGQGEFPFYFVQLSSWNADNGNSQKGSSWAELREAQTMTLSLPNTGMAVTIDIGDANDIHPRNKKDVGYRLAAVALQGTYGKTVVSRGPVYQAMRVVDDKLVVEFKDFGSPLDVRDKYGYVRGFEVAGADQKFYPARASVEGNTVLLHSPNVSKPVAVRYGWADDAGECNLFNKAGFPAEPFRTDTFPGITEKNKFQIH